MKVEAANRSGVHVIFDGQTVQIRRPKPTLSALLAGGLRGDKTIPISMITAVQLKAAGEIVSGYVQFSLMGGREPGGGAMNAASDENSVLFGPQHQADFEALAAAVTAAIAGRSAPASAAPRSVADEIEKLAALRARGILTDSEFETEKAKLLR